MADEEQSFDIPMEREQVPLASTSDSVEGTQENHTPPPNEASIELERKDVNERRSPNKRRLTSQVWLHFKREKIDDKWKAICKYCDRKLGGDTKQGTKHLHDHIRTCKLHTVPSQSENTPQQSSSSIGNSGESLVGAYVNHDNARRELEKMIIMHEYPLGMVDHVGFKRFSKSLNPLFEVSPNTLKSDIMKIYESEKIKVMKLLAKNTGRIAITIDMWTSSNQNKEYMSVIAHYIDDSWTLQSRIVRFIYVPAPHTAEVLCDVLVECLLDWNLDKKLSTLTVDNCSTDDVMIERLLDKIPHSSFILRGELFHMRCCAHVLDMIVKDVLLTITDAIEKVRESVAFWTATPNREKKFRDACHQLNITYSQKLVLDCRTKWNSTYLMLTCALPYQDVFKQLKQHDSQYKSLPSEEDWKMTNDICEKLELFFSVTELFSGTRYPTSNIYFPKVCEIRLSLRKWVNSSSDIIRSMASNMILKFDKYWGSINRVMAIGVVLDPRYKMALLNYFFLLMYGDNASSELQRVKTMWQNLVDEYQVKNKNRGFTSGDAISSSTLTGPSSLVRKKNWKCDYFQYVKENVSSSVCRSELDYYLEEPVLIGALNVEDFDILSWWKQNGLKYPTLQRIARDFLAIPIFTVASKSAFSTSDRVLSPHRSKLNKNTLEALMCTQDWSRQELKGSYKENGKIQTILEDMDVDDDVESFI